MATLHFICGKAGSGKTTLGRQIAREAPAVFICEDEWLQKLAPGISSVRQYVEATANIRRVIAPLTIQLLKLGTSVVFDFAGNTVRERAWVRAIVEAAGAAHVLHCLEVDENTCWQRIEARSAARPDGLFFGPVTRELFDEVTRYLVAPSSGEGFHVQVHR